MRKCEPFFCDLAKMHLAVTYDEVRLKTDYSEIMPGEVSLESKFSRNVPLKIPIVSAAMDTVTESPMAIAMAKLGGIGIIHKNLSPKDQGEEVRRVKFHLSGIITKPICVKEEMTIKEIGKMRKEKGFSFHSFPVIDSDGKLTGILTENDFAFCKQDNARAFEIMTRDPITAPKKTAIHDAYARMIAIKRKVLPLIDDSGILAGMYLFSDLDRIISGTSSHHNVDDEGRLRVAAATGILEDAFERIEALRDNNGGFYADAVVIDTAHGDSKDVIETVRRIKLDYSIDVVVGNISQGNSAIRLMSAGADGIKVGQGPGSICTTRIVAGIGCPQVTAVYDASKAVEQSGIPICADGGIEHSGDIPIAIGAGAHSVMLGKLLAGTKEAPGEVDFQTGKPTKRYRGMGSLSALEQSTSSRSRYRETATEKDKLVPEGVEAVIPYVGDLATVMHQYIGGLRKGMGYLGAKDINNLQQNAEFYRITQAGMRESHPHGILIRHDSPNYRSESE